MVFLLYFRLFVPGDDGGEVLGTDGACAGGGHVVGELLGGAEVILALQRFAYLLAEGS